MAKKGSTAPTRSRSALSDRAKALKAKTVRAKTAQVASVSARAAGPPSRRGRGRTSRRVATPTRPAPAKAEDCALADPCIFLRHLIGPEGRARGVPDRRCFTAYPPVRKRARIFSRAATAGKTCRRSLLARALALARSISMRIEVGWSNRMILGDSLIVMNSLLERERLSRQGAVHLCRSAIRCEVRNRTSSPSIFEARG